MTRKGFKVIGTSVSRRAWWTPIMNFQVMLECWVAAWQRGIPNLLRPARGRRISSHVLIAKEIVQLQLVTAMAISHIG